MALSDEQRRKLNEKAAARSQEQSNYRPPFETQHMSQKVPVSQQDWFVILMLILFFPVGLYLMWHEEKWTKNTRIVVSILVGIVAFAAIRSGGSWNRKAAPASTPSVVQTETVPEEESVAEQTSAPVAEEPAVVEEPVVEEQTQPSMSEQEFKASCQPFDYKTVARNPDAYIGQNFVIDAEVFITDVGGLLSGYDKCYKCLLKSDNEYLSDTYIGEMIFVLDEQDESSSSYLRVLDGDVIMIYGTFEGMISTNNALTGSNGEEIALHMKYAELISE